MPSRPPPTTACTRSRGGSSATGMPRKMPCRTRSSKPGGTSGAFGIPVPSMPGSTDCSSMPATTRSGARAGDRSSCSAWTIERAEPDDDVARLVDRDELERAFLDLSVEHRAVLVLTHYVGLPASEVGAHPAHPAGDGRLTSPLRHPSAMRRPSIARDAPMAHPPRSLADERDDGSGACRLAGRGSPSGARVKAWSARSRRPVASASDLVGRGRVVAPHGPDHGSDAVAAFDPRDGDARVAPRGARRCRALHRIRARCRRRRSATAPSCTRRTVTCSWPTSLDGTSRKLVAGPDHDSEPIFSPQGDRIASCAKGGTAAPLHDGPTWTDRT